MLGAATIAVAAAIGLAVYALTLGGDANPTARNERGPAVAVCRSSQLAASAELQGGTQSLLGWVTIANTTRAACSLPPGRPAVIVDAAGKPRRIDESRAEPVPPGSAPRATPGALGAVHVQWTNWCGGTS